MLVEYMKYLLGKVKGHRPYFQKALHEYRKTPRSSDGLSPSQWAFGSWQCPEAPALGNADNRLNDQGFYSALDRREESQAKVKSDFDWNRKPDSILLNGTNALVQRKKKNSKNGPWDQKGIIVSKRPNRNSYIVDIGGQEFLRSRLFLRPVLDISEKDSFIMMEDKDTEP